MKHIPDIRALLRHMNKASDFMRWLRAEGDSLVASADLLGGRKWAARARTVVEAAKAGSGLGARRGELHALNRLLRLGFSTDIKSVEARRFAAVHQLAFAGSAPDAGGRSDPMQVSPIGRATEQGVSLLSLDGGPVNILIFHD